MRSAFSSLPARGVRAAALRRSRRGGRRLALAAALLVALLLAACAKTSDVQKVDEANRVQDQRLSALENDVGKTLDEQRAQVRKLTTDVRAAQGRMDLVEQRTQTMENEQKALTESLERSLADQRKLARQMQDELAKMQRGKLESDSDLDKMRNQLTELEKLLKSPIAGLPDKTQADKDFRNAYFELINGQFDVAADQFGQFIKTYPKDERDTEARFRRGQAYFLMRRYDHALVPLFELLDKAPKDKLAVPARWYVARSLEETGDLKLAREFYAGLINDKTPYAADATRRVAFINRLFPRSATDAGSEKKK